MSRDEFEALVIGERVRIERGLALPPHCGVLADKINDSALVSIGHNGNKPILIWAHYARIKKVEV